MAEIKVQRRGPSAWLWVVDILALAVVIWAIVGSRDRDSQAVTVVRTPATPSIPQPAGTTGVAPPAAVAAYLTFVEVPGHSIVGVDHAYAADGIRRLTGALNAVIEQGGRGNRTSVQEQLAAFRQKADRIQSDPRSMSHSDQVRDVFTNAAGLMAALQSERWPSADGLQREIADVKTAAESVQADRPLLDQSSAVKTFFERAAAVLRVMTDQQTSRS